MCYLWCHWKADNNGTLKPGKNNLKCLNAFESREKTFTVSSTAALQAVHMRKCNASTATRSLVRVIDNLVSFMVTKIEHPPKTENIVWTVCTEMGV
jgi:hypothetical protein